MSEHPSLDNPIDVIEPPRLESPIVVSSPHSGSRYPAELMAMTVLSRTALRRSEDCYVDELFSSAPAAGVPLIRANYPRAFVDLNREPYELDPTMFSDDLPNFANTTSPRVAAGLGTIARIVASQKEIYANKLTWAQAQRRIESLYKPYHTALRRLVNTARDQFGYCILIDCHSMPSAGLPDGKGRVGEPVDIVLGDRNGLSCASSITEETEQAFERMGYSVIRNNPYAGGFTTQHYGDPLNGVHAIQIELNRALYVDENSLNRKPGFATLKSDLTKFLDALAAYSREIHPELMYRRLSAE